MEKFKIITMADLKKFIILGTMNYSKFLIFMIFIILAACKPSDFSIKTPAVVNGSSKVNFDHTPFVNVSCIQCHENKRPVTVPVHGDGKDCIGCHSAQLNALGERTWLNLSHFDHNPMPLSCVQCHEGARPNGKNGRASISPHMPGQWGATQDCVSCHKYPQWKGLDATGKSYTFFDHKKPLTSCMECHNTPTKDSRPLVGFGESSFPFHPQTYFDTLSSVNGDNILGSYLNGSLVTQNTSTIPLTPNQQSLLTRITTKTLATTDQMDCILCHQNSDNTRVWTQDSTSPRSVLFYYNAATDVLNQHIIVDPNQDPTGPNYLVGYKEPTQCMTCHENIRPSTHISMDSSKTIVASGMNTGDCIGCHTYSKIGGLPAAQKADWKANVRAFVHEVAKPVTCMDCHKASVPANQKAIGSTPSTHPVATGSYNKIDCTQCHTYDNTLTPPTSTVPQRSWANIAFDYKTHFKADGVTSPASCLQCHKVDNNSLPNPTLNASHTAGARSNNDCQICHTFSAQNKWYSFKPGFNHAVLDTKGSADRCDSCHKASVQINTTIKNPLSNIPGLATRSVNPTVHIPVPTILANGVQNPVDCNSCHSSTTSWKMPDVNYVHGNSDACSTCHNMSNPKNIGMPAVTQKGTNHFPYGSSLECSSCHTNTTTVNFTQWKYLNPPSVVFDHKDVKNQSCSSCHNDPTYSGTVKQLPSPLGTAHLVVPNGSDCNTCHNSTTTFVGMSGASIFVTYTHNLAVDNDCNSCHKGTNSILPGFAKGPKAAPTTHMDIPFVVMNGSVTTNPVQCSTCHQEVTANGLNTQIRTSPDFKIHTDINTKISAGATPDTRCNICHDGANATGKTIAGFVPSANFSVHPALGSLQCVACHSASLTTTPKYKDFTGGGFTHNATNTNNFTTCNSCHAGASAIATTVSAFTDTATGKGHIPTSAECITCHQASQSRNFDTFIGGNYSHSDAVTLSCKTCHDNATVRSKDLPLSQKTVDPTARGGLVHTNNPTAKCETCHSNLTAGVAAPNYTTWTIHTTAATSTDTSCNTCHTGTANTFGKTTATFAGHVAIGTSQCIACHTTVLSKTPKYLDFKGGTYTHTGTETCSTCHANPTASGGALQVTTSVLHSANATVACNTCHTPVNASNIADPNNYLTFKIHTGTATSNNSSCTSCHMTTQAPLVIKNTSMSAGFNHFTISKADGSAAQCSVCHQASIVGVTAYPSFSPVDFKGGLFHSVNSGITATNSCTTCHTSSLSRASASMMMALPSTTSNPALHLTLPIASGTTAVQCDTCHKDASFVSWKGMTLSTPSSQNVNFTHNTTRDTNCLACHTGTAGFAEGKDHYKNASGVKLHMATTAQCSTCHQNADAAGTLTVKTTTDFKIHTDIGTQSDSRCNICHDGAGAIGKTTAAYVPTAGLPNHPTVGTQQCVLCHQASLGSTPKYLTFAGGNQHTAANTNNFTSCNSCHLSGTGTIQNINNSPGYNHFSIAKADGSKAECYTCHAASVNSTNPSLGFKNFGGGIFHSNSTSSGVSSAACTTCHKPSGAAYTPFKQYPATHLPLPSGSECSTCHVTTTFAAGTFKGMPLTTGTLNVTYTHVAADLTTCNTCHTGTLGFAEGLSNVPGLTHITLPKSGGVDVNCNTCHNISTSAGAVWKGIASKVVSPNPVTVSYNHLTIGTAACNTCHNDGTVAAPITHGVPTGTAQAATSPFNPVAHIATAGSDCLGCHAVSKTGGAAVVNGTTRNIAAFETFYGGSNKDHSSATTNCMGCHWSGNGSTGSIQNAPNTVAGFKHFNITNTAGTGVAQCYTCHAATTGGTNGAAAFVKWSGGKYHTITSPGISSTACNTCHSSTTFTGVTKFPTSHLTVPSGSDCNTCHKDTAFSSWKGMLSTTPSAVKVSYTHNTSTDTTCTTCHQTNTAVSPYVNKVGYATGITNTTVHTSNSTVNCSTCHQVVSGTTLAPKFANDFKIHDATNTANASKCNICHLVSATGAITNYNNGSNTGFTHFPYKNGTTYAECQTCHQASINVTAPAVAYASFAGGLFHSTTLNSGVPTTACATCHKASGTAFAGVTAISTISTHLTLPVPTTPTGNTTPTDCSTCHNTTTAWKGTVYTTPTAIKVAYAHNINATTDVNCSTCHDVSKTVGFATGKAAGVTVHGTTAGAQQCSVCHMSVVTATTTAAKITSNFLIHDTTNLTASKNRCNVCHMNTATSSATVASINFYNASGTYSHFPIKTTATAATYAECSICHNSVLSAGTTGSLVSTYNFAGGTFHSKVTASAVVSTTCAVCHNSTYTTTATNYKKLPAGTGHLALTASTGVTANAECSICHKVTNDNATITNQWAGMFLANAKNPTTVPLNVTYLHKAGDTTCSTCHTGNLGFAEGSLTNGNGHLTIPLAVGSTTAKAECAACHIVSTTSSATDSWKSWRAATPQVVYNTHNLTATTACTTCHSNAAGFAKGTAADTTIGGHPVVTGMECSTCHLATSSTTTTAVYNDFKNPRDHRSTANCLSCHYNTANNTFLNINANSTYKHFPILNSSNAAVQCSVCHQASMTVSRAYNNFTGGLLHSLASANSITVTAKCNTCHTSTYSTTATSFMAVTATHLNVTNLTGTTNCDTCHKDTTYVTWKGMNLKQNASAPLVTVMYDHASKGTLACNTCHMGTTTSSGLASGTANIPGLTHLGIPTGKDCSECHNIATASGAVWKGMKSNNITPVTVAYTHPTTGMPACNTCHGDGSSVGPTVAPTAPLVARGMATGTAHITLSTTGATYMNAQTPKQVNHIKTNSADCMGCHNSSMTTYTSFSGGLATDHRLGADCLSCHYNTSTNMIANYSSSPGYSHFPILKTGGTPAQCSTCHSASQQPGRNYDNFTAGDYHSNMTLSAVPSTTCSTCHNGSYTYGTTSFFKLPTVGTLHLNPTQPNLTATTTQINRGECSVCHTVTNDSPSFENTWKTWRAPLANPNPVSFTTAGSFTTLNAHGFAVNDPIAFKTSGTLPTQIVAGTTYYIKTVPTTTTFTISATAGGTAITTLSAASTGTTYVYPVVTFNTPTFAAISSYKASQTTSLTFTAGNSNITMSTALTLAIGDPVQLTGTVPTNLSTNAIYYIKSVSGTTITLGISNNNGAVGTVVVPASATTSTMVTSNVFTTTAAHGIAATALPIEVTFRGTTLPTGLVADQVYYVSAVPTTTTFIASSVVPASLAFTTTSVNIGLNTTATGTATSLTYSKPVAATVTYSGHGLAANDQVIFDSTGTLPAGIAQGQAYMVNTVTGSSFTIKTMPATLVAGTYTLPINILSAVAPTGTITLTKPIKTVYQVHSTTNDTNCNACHTGAAGFAKGVNSILSSSGTALHVSTGTNQCSVCHTGTAGTGTMTYTGFTGGNYNHNTGSNTFLVAGAYHASQPSCIICHNNYTSQPASANTVSWINKETGVKNACLGCHVAAFNFNATHFTGFDSTTRSTTNSTTGTVFIKSTSSTSTTAGKSGRAQCLSCHSYGNSGLGTKVTPTDGNKVRGYVPKTVQ